MMQDFTIEAYKRDLGEMFADPLPDRLEAKLALHVFSLADDVRRMDGPVADEALKLWELMEPKVDRLRIKASEEAKKQIFNLGVYKLRGAEGFTLDDLLEMELNLFMLQYFFSMPEGKAALIDEVFEQYTSLQLEFFQGLDSSATALPMHSQFKLVKFKNAALADVEQGARTIMEMHRSLIRVRQYNETG